MEKDYKMPVSVNSGGTNRPTLMWMLAGITIGLGSGLAMYFLSNKNVERELTVLSEHPNEVTDRIQKVLQENENKVLAEAEEQASAQSAKATSDNVIEQTSQAMMDDARKDEKIAEFDFYSILPALDGTVPSALIIPEPGSRGSYKAPRAEPVALTHDKTIPPLSSVKDIPVEPKKATVQEAVPVKVSSAANLKYSRLQTASYVSATAAQNKLREFKQMGMQGSVEKAWVNGKAWHRVIIGPTNDPKQLSKWKIALNGMGIKPMLKQ